MELAVALSLLSVGSLIVCALLLPVVVVRLPEDYFARPTREAPWSEWGWLRKLIAVVRCTIGGLFVIAGIVLLVLPGQGLLMILVGVLLAEFPGKFRLERAIARRTAIRASLDAIRRWFGAPPLLHWPGGPRRPPRSEPEAS